MAWDRNAEASLMALLRQIVREEVQAAFDEAIAKNPKSLAECGTQRLIDRAIARERERVADEESKLWDRCFGPQAPKDEKAKRDVVVSMASARALLSILNKPAS